MSDDLWLFVWGTETESILTDEILCSPSAESIHTWGWHD